MVCIVTALTVAKHVSALMSLGGNCIRTVVSYELGGFHGKKCGGARIHVEDNDYEMYATVSRDIVYPKLWFLQFTSV